MLNTVIHGEPGPNPPLLIAHGLFGSARNWGVIAKRLSDERQVVVVDMRNHGHSDWWQSHRYVDLARDLSDVVYSLGGKVDLLGHSMGGKAAMVLAADRPNFINRLIVADIAPVGYSHTQMPLVKAMAGLDFGNVQTRGDADKLLETEIPDAGIRAFLLQSIDIKEKKWRLNLQVLANDMDHIIGFPDVDGRYDGPCLFLTGSNSEYVLPDHRPRIKELFPKARVAKIPGAGHWLHAEKPREFEAAVRVFLNS